MNFSSFLSYLFFDALYGTNLSLIHKSSKFIIVNPPLFDGLIVTHLCITYSKKLINEFYKLNLNSKLLFSTSLVSFYEFMVRNNPSKKLFNE